VSHAPAGSFSFGRLGEARKDGLGSATFRALVFLEPIALMIPLQRACSSPRKAVYSSGVDGAGIPLTLANCSISAGELNAAIEASWILLTTAGGVPAGATRPYQLSEITLG